MIEYPRVEVDYCAMKVESIEEMQEMIYDSSLLTVGRATMFTATPIRI